MSIKLLDPTNDLVFKMLLLRKQDLLRDMIDAVPELPQPIEDLEVQNPEIPKDFPGDKSVVLDIRVCLHNGHQIDLEMQSTVPPGTRARFLYYWAKAFTDSIGIGADYTLLRPCISILWFKESLLLGSRFHSIFHLSEDESRDWFTEEIEFHILELPKLHLAGPHRQAKHPAMGSLPTGSNGRGTRRASTRGCHHDDSKRHASRAFVGSGGAALGA